MKYAELHRIIWKNHWRPLPERGKGSHIRYEKDGKVYTVPFHKGKEIDDIFARKILKDLNINLANEKG